MTHILFCLAVPLEEIILYRHGVKKQEMQMVQRQMVQCGHMFVGKNNNISLKTSDSGSSVFCYP